ncbi:AAA family ATPase [Pseudonocardia sp. HH130629-09]|uniref:AAA family ATPase n=1 Tax=Pseudonocardia sp. HH130629-09 TaxID=1641402 RepID=UPI0006CAFAFF|nr:helix-turn-helix transcriptional regulator [Pseudonocardia sp. HH130629-09]ALE82598.1 SelRIII [Pseudonocardia sp. HH130629-09]
MLRDREPELRVLRDAVLRAADGRGGAILLGGGLGTGRTALLDAAADIAVAAGLRVLRATADVVEQDFDHGVARQLFDPLLATAARGDRERWLAGRDVPQALAYVPADADDPTVAHRWIQELQDLLEAVAAGGPVAVCVDDLQWADGPSQRWLNHLAVRVTGLPVVLVATALDGDPCSQRPPVRAFARSAAVLRARRLPPEAVDAVIAERFWPAAAPEFVLACHETCAGNPLILDTVLGELVAAGVRPDAAQAGAVRAARPVALRERLARCVRGQDPSARRYLRAVAVLGAGPDPEVLRRLGELDRADLRTVPASLVEQGLLTGQGVVRVVHPLVEEVATEPAEREDLHHRAARYLHEFGHPALEVAGHLLAVTAPLATWAIEVLRAAAQQAAATPVPDARHSGVPDPDAVDTAIRCLRRALLDSGATSRERGVLLVELASVERFVEPGTAVRHVAQALPLLDSARDRAAALTLIDPAMCRDAPDSVQEAIRRADTGDADGTVALRIRARARRMAEERPEGLAESCHLLREVLRAPDAMLSTSAGRELVGVLLHAAMLTGHVPARDIAHLGERLLRITPARQLPPPPGVPPGDGPRGLLVLALVAADRPAPVEAWLAGQGDRDPAVASADELALVQLAQGRVAAAALPGVLRAAGPPTAFHAALLAAALDSRVLVPGRAVTDRPPGVGLLAHVTHQMMRAARACAHEEPDLALECFLDGGRHLDHLGWRNPALFPWRGWAARLYGRRGEYDAAVAYADEQLTLAEAWGAPAALGRALRIRGSLAEGADGTAQLRAAVDVLAGSGDLRELGRSEIALGGRLARAGDPAGDELVRRGRQRTAELGADAAATVDPAPAPAAGGTPPAEPATEAAAGPTGPEGPDPLTEAERRVVRLAVGGATNQAIADDLGISRRAVEKRLTSVYRKLGVSGRAALPGAG